MAQQDSGGFARYAVYYTPPPGALADFGAQWLGWDCAVGAGIAQPPLAGLDIAALTETPRRYGFHATVKPPFALAEGQSAATLQAEFAVLCRRMQVVVLTGLCLSRLGRFMALTPQGDTGALGHLAASVMRGLEVWRAPLTDAETARRTTPTLSPRQQANLRDWGYPHVMQDFRFHMTLTGKLSRSTLEKVQAILETRLAGLLPRPFVIDSLTLLGQRADGMFIEIQRCALGRSG